MEKSKNLSKEVDVVVNKMMRKMMKSRKGISSKKRKLQWTDLRENKSRMKVMMKKKIKRKMKNKSYLRNV